jgi:hypothetical protein
MKILKGDFENNGYDFTQRAYIIDCSNKDAESLELELLADSESPLVNACLVINNWETDDISVQINGTELQENSGYRLGKRKDMEKEDLIIWIEKKSETNVQILIKNN